MPGDIDRSVSGSLRLSSIQGRYGYDRLTLQDIEDWCIEARVYGAKPDADVTVYHSSSFADSLSVAVPARHDFLLRCRIRAQTRNSTAGSPGSPRSQ